MFKAEFFEDIHKDLNKVEKAMEAFVQSSNPLLTEASTHLLLAGGKRIRPAFVLLAGKFHNYSLNKLLPLAVAVEMVHMASLVHDDIVDASLTRRGRPTVKAKWGDKISLHAGDYLLSKALAILAQYKDKRILNLLTKSSIQMCRGEIHQLTTTYDVNQSIKDYFYRIKRKTALLISASCQLGALVTDAPAPLVNSLNRYGHYIGMSFQITDDILDMVADEKELGKPVGSDLRQGIITLPAIFALQKHGQRSEFARLIQTRDKTDNQIKRAIDVIIASDGIKLSSSVAKKYAEKAKKEIIKLPPVKYRNTLEQMADFICTRKY